MPFCQLDVCLYEVAIDLRLVANKLPNLYPSILANIQSSNSLSTRHIISQCPIPLGKLQYVCVDFTLPIDTLIYLSIANTISHTNTHICPALTRDISYMILVPFSNAPIFLKVNLWHTKHILSQTPDKL